MPPRTTRSFAAAGVGAQQLGWEVHRFAGAKRGRSSGCFYLSFFFLGGGLVLFCFWYEQLRLAKTWLAKSPDFRSR